MHPCGVHCGTGHSVRKSRDAHIRSKVFELAQNAPASTHQLVPARTIWGTRRSIQYRRCGCWTEAASLLCCWEVCVWEGVSRSGGPLQRILLAEWVGGCFSWMFGAIPRGRLDVHTAATPSTAFGVLFFRGQVLFGRAMRLKLITGPGRRMAIAYCLGIAIL